MEQLQLALESRAFELAYERACHQVETICDVERLRQLRVRALILEKDKEDLHSREVQDDHRIIELERSNERLLGDLRVCGDNLENARGQLRIKSREVETMKAELNSLHGVTMDSTKLLTEKLTIARELSALKPELDHLRSQNASHQSLFAEKLSLQRQLSTVQVELATEKSATQRALAKEGKLQAEDAELESRLESVQADLLKERRERQKLERKAQQDSTESGDRITTLESRLDAFRNKLKSTKEQLREAQMSLQTTQLSNHRKPSRAATSVNPSTSLMGNPRKRGAAQMDVDTILGTPGDLPAAKKSKRGSTLIGEKSTFSITPFLNRTASVASESPLPANANGADEMNSKGYDHLSGNVVNREAASSKGISDLVEMSHPLANVVQANKHGMLQNAKAGKINSKVPPARKPKAAPTLEQVAEENIENGGSTTKISEPTAIQSASTDTFHGGLEINRRKRKLLGGGLGKTLFDEDVEGALKSDHGLLVGVRSFGPLGKGGLRVSEKGPRKAAGPNFGAISPLKKDRTLLNRLFLQNLNKPASQSERRWHSIDFMFSRRPKSGSNYSGLSTLTCTCVHIWWQARSGLGGRSLLKQDGLSVHSYSSSSSSKRWQARQKKDRFAVNAKVQGLKSRAAFKLLEINEKYKIFRGGQTVVDLGYAPGSWSQVAVDRTFPNGRVLGIDIIPARPPKGVSTIQGNFLSPTVQEEVKRFLRESDRGRTKQEPSFIAEDEEDQMTEEDLEQSSRCYLELKKRSDGRTSSDADGVAPTMRGSRSNAGKLGSGMVDVVLNDMSEPWEQTEGFWKRSLSDPYYRMMNVSGVSFKDHAGSMDLCDAALRFTFDTLRTGGHFVCKFYQGSEDKALELRLKNIFSKVHREKPASSRSESKEAYFVALRRRAGC